MKHSEVADKAADEIQKRGLGKGDFWKPNANGDATYATGQFCMMGAVRYAVTSNPYDPDGRLVEEVLVAVIGTLPKGTYWIPSWNDRRGVNASHAVRKLRAVAKKFREEGR